LRDCRAAGLELRISMAASSCRSLKLCCFRLFESVRLEVLMCPGRCMHRTMATKCHYRISNLAQPYFG
jgi:hypothetical protein